MNVGLSSRGFCIALICSLVVLRVVEIDSELSLLAVIALSLLAVIELSLLAVITLSFPFSAWVSTRLVTTVSEK